ncbi:type I-F CRISPR-associated protein Csy2 [Mergibacter septicus]|uniref:Type I-F CRISPR-associated protein Csy2 n=2 Tax=Mergibacter septicus TaxID=221402 RepID=A0A8D4LLM9_9PAST|nr:type I-F CRISPR-associated protein Csy2 [Mergibacter septicus]QDJ14048.1 type I-F CRISPR-associated protein Csy2 [Mergibacter septicus]
MGDDIMEYLILKRIKVSNANAIAGFTYGFPAVTHFLGYVHALSRKLQGQGITLSDTAILCHQAQIHAYRENNYKPYRFALTRNPLKKDGKPDSINEEGKMYLEVSLIIKVTGINAASEEGVKEKCKEIKALAEQQKLAGGTINSIQFCSHITNDQPTKILRSLLPGFILVDRSDLLAQTSQTDKLKQWLSFSALKFNAHKIIEENNTTEQESEKKEKKKKIEWRQEQKQGYLVPIQIGYKAISQTYAANQVANSRDQTTPVTFVEAIHSIAEWVGSPSRITSMAQILWTYHYAAPFYVCHCCKQDLPPPTTVLENADDTY